MQRVLDEAWQQRSPDLPFQTPYEALILASIIEKETGLPAERPKIAGVFVTRLRKGMRLQTDPAVIYGLGASYDGNIRTRDLTTDTPYNTYTRAGLPPTPIALPGRESILAAVKPQETGEIYFVATGTGDGGHHFSKTLEEHNAAVKSYLEHLRAAARRRRRRRDRLRRERMATSPNRGTLHHPRRHRGRRQINSGATRERMARRARDHRARHARAGRHAARRACAKDRSGPRRRSRLAASRNIADVCCAQHSC